jgi:hypothetical protein
MAHEEEHSHSGPSPRAFFTNFRTYDAPFMTKLRLAVRNNVTKIRTKSSCCGHPGEPGC